MNKELEREYKVDNHISIDLLNNYNKNVPHIIKYMGSKRKILDFVIEAINDSYPGGRVVDLFAGTSILAGALGKLIEIHSNDIQEYSAVLAKTYLSSYNEYYNTTDILGQIVEKASDYVRQFQLQYSKLEFNYNEKNSITEFIKLENLQQQLINHSFSGFSHHLFVKYYSGTYWSYKQCLWIDSLRKVADEYRGTPFYYMILSSLMYAMSYNSQSTGHYAQYRDATSLKSQNDILTYRQRDILPYFENKFQQLQNFVENSYLNHEITSLDFSACLDIVQPYSLVYADPPYASVHYSRFYHTLETLVKYDYPTVNFKGRYRSERHQSPFCRHSEVKSAFMTLFQKIKAKKANLVLSYSNSGMITLDEILKIAESVFKNHCNIEIRELSYIHSTMGRKEDKSRRVQEYLVLFKFK